MEILLLENDHSEFLQEKIKINCELCKRSANVDLGCIWRIGITYDLRSINKIRIKILL